LRWVRPVKPHGLLLAGDIRYPDGSLMRTGDVVAWKTGARRSTPPHVEDVLVEPVRDRPQFVRRLAPSSRAEFCAKHLDRSPDDVLVHETRSLCLIRPDSVAATWTHDSYNGHYEARMAFRLGGFATEPRGIPVTDLTWRALGRTWIEGECLRLDDAALRERLGAVYLVVGRGRMYEGRHWPLVVGVHAAGLPEVNIDQEKL
jgi:hypothetical protein